MKATEPEARQMFSDYCILPIGHGRKCLFASVMPNVYKCNRANMAACEDCGTRGPHSCPADIAKGD